MPTSPATTRLTGIRRQNKRWFKRRAPFQAKDVRKEPKRYQDDGQYKDPRAYYSGRTLPLWFESVDWLAAIAVRAIRESLALTLL